MRRPFSAFVLVLGLFLLVAPGCGEGGAEDGAVHVLRVEGTVGPIMERFIDRGITRAEDNDAKLVLIELDTPGGLSESMRDIIRRIERSKVPVAVYVTPPGGRAASAGTFITMAAHVAAMAPNTSIGAASAINSDGSDIEGALGRKIENDAVALIRGLAESRGRNADWAEDAVRDAIAATATDAVELNVVDFIADSTPQVLEKSEGRTVTVADGREVTLTGLPDAPLVRTEYSVWEHLLEFIADPTIASLLISLGFLGLIFELASPGLFIPGIAGAIALVTGFLGFGILPVNTIGLVLIFFALVLFGLELFVPSGGALGAGGALALVLGGIIAFHDTPAEFRPPTWMLVIIGIFILSLFGMIVFSIRSVSKWSAEASTRGLVGKVAVARTQLTPGGYVFVQGERWRARAERGVINEGEQVRITESDGFILRVRKLEAQDPGPKGPAGPSPASTIDQITG